MAGREEVVSAEAMGRLGDAVGQAFVVLVVLAYSKRVEFLLHRDGKAGFLRQVEGRFLFSNISHHRCCLCAIMSTS